MTDQPLTPPPESLVREWAAASGTHYPDLATFCVRLADQAAQWGWDQREPEIQAAADAELDSSSNWLVLNGYGKAVSKLRAARRFRPPSLKQSGFTALELLKQRTTDPNIIEPLSRALEALSNDQH